MAIFRPLDLAVLVSSSIITALLSIRFSLSTCVLEGLRMYVPAGSGGEQGTGPASGKKRGKGTIGGGKDDVDLGGAETLFVIPMSRAHVQLAPFFSVLEALVYALQLSIFTSIAYPALHRFSDIRYYSTPLAMAVAVAGISISSLVRVDLFSQYTSASDKAYAAVFALLGFFGASATFAVSSPSAFVWKPAEASQVAKLLLEDVARRTMSNATISDIKAMSSIAPSPLGVQLLFSLIGALLAAILFAPSLRFVRAYLLQQSPPEWVQGYIDNRFILGTARLHLHLILPVISALLWVSALFQDPLGLTDCQAAISRATFAAGSGMLMILNCKLLMARYLETALLGWYTVKHGAARRNKGGRMAAGMLIQAKSDAVRRLMCKAAVQSMAPGVLLLCCGLSLGGFLSAQCGDNANANLGRLVTSVAGFIIWWMGAIWFFYTALILWLFRTGTLAN